MAVHAQKMEMGRGGDSDGQVTEHAVNYSHRSSHEKTPGESKKAKRSIAPSKRLHLEAI